MGQIKSASIFSGGVGSGPHPTDELMVAVNRSVYKEHVLYVVRAAVEFAADERGLSDQKQFITVEYVNETEESPALKIIREGLKARGDSDLSS